MINSLLQQHKQANDELVQSSRNLFNQFCHQQKYSFYETQIYTYFKRQTVLYISLLNG